MSTLKSETNVFFFFSLGGERLRESEYQAELIKKLKHLFPGCIILKNDPNYLQGIMDLTIFYGPKWATLEVKASKDAPERPNQGYYVQAMREMSFSAFIYPENEEEVLNALQSALGSGGEARLPRSQ